MSYRLIYEVTIQFCPDGPGQMMQGVSSNQMSFQQSGPFNPSIPGGNTLTQANLTTALNSMATDILNQVVSITPDQVTSSGFTTNLQRLQGFSTGAAQ